MVLFISNFTVLAADYDIQPVSVNSQALDDVSDSYKITIHEGSYKVNNTLSHDELKNKLKVRCAKYKKLMWVTGGLIMV